MKALNRLIVGVMPLVPRAIVRRVAHRYVAGETLTHALETVRLLNAEGCMATLDVLGEDVSEIGETERTVDEYLRALDGIAAHGLDANVSVKLTALGLKIDPAHCRREFARIVEGACRHGNFVRIDMEDSSVTTETIEIFSEARRTYERLGFVLQRPKQHFYQALAAGITAAVESAAGFRGAAHIDYVESQTPADVVAKLKSVAARSQAVAMVAIDHPTITAAVAELRDAGIPVIGVNFGRVGFLSSVRPEELEAGLRRAFAGELDVVDGWEGRFFDFPADAEEAFKAEGFKAASQYMTDEYMDKLPVIPGTSIKEIKERLQPFIEAGVTRLVVPYVPVDEPVIADARRFVEAWGNS